MVTFFFNEFPLLSPESRSDFTVWLRNENEKKISWTYCSTGCPIFLARFPYISKDRWTGMDNGKLCSYERTQWCRRLRRPESCTWLSCGTRTTLERQRYLKYGQKNIKTGSPTGVRICKFPPLDLFFQTDRPTDQLIDKRVLREIFKWVQITQ